MGQVLVKWDSNWADEMDISGFTIMDKEEWNELKDTLRKKTGAFSICVGTNEEIDYDNGRELLDELTGKDITPDEVKVIEKFLGSEFGFTEFSFPVDEDDEEDDDYEADLDLNDEDY